MYLIEEMKNLYKEIQKMNLDKYILHNDLNHKNILKSENGWKVIDPHGVLSISKELGEDKKLILKFLYIRIVEKIIWFVKVNENKDIISYNIDVANNVLKLIKNE